MKKAFAAAALTVGGVVGAGFASGREAVIFFGGANVISAAVFAALFFASACFFMTRGGGDLPSLSREVFGKMCFLPLAALNVNYFVCLAAMSAGCFAVCGKAAGLLPVSACAAAVYLGVGGVKKLSYLTVPLVIACLAAVVLPVGEVSAADVKIVGPMCYAAYNAVLTAGVLLPAGGALTKKQACLAAGLAAAVLFLLTLAVSAAAGQSGQNMPLASVAAAKGLYGVYSAALLLGMTSAMASAAFPLCAATEKITRDRLVAVAAVFVAAYCVGTLGFGKVMDTALPVVSAVSLAALAGFFAVSAYKKIKAR